MRAKRKFGDWYMRLVNEKNCEVLLKIIHHVIEGKLLKLSTFSLKLSFTFFL